MEAGDELNKSVEGEMGDAVVVLFANTFIPSTATRLGNMLTDVRKNGDLWWWYAGGAGGDSAATVLALGGKVQAPAYGVGRDKLTRAALEAVGRVRRLEAGAWSCRRQNDVSLGFFPRRCGGSHGFWWCWCGAAMRVCQTFSASS